MDNLSSVLKDRRKKTQDLIESGVHVFRNDFKDPQAISDVVLKGEQLGTEANEVPDTSYRIAGRVMSMRKFGKAAFFHVQDATGRMQAYAKSDTVGEEAYTIFKKWDVGDIVAVEGPLFRTKTGSSQLMRNH